MHHRLRLLLAVPILASSLVTATAPVAQAQWHHGYRGGYGRGGYHGGGYHHRGGGGLLLGGLAAGAVLGVVGAGLLANSSRPPPVVYGPPVAYAQPPVVYAQPPPPGYYGGY